jgi:hypothetical protein
LSSSNRTPSAIASKHVKTYSHEPRTLAPPTEHLKPSHQKHSLLDHQGVSLQISLPLRVSLFWPWEDMPHKVTTAEILDGSSSRSVYAWWPPHLAQNFGQQGKVLMEPLQWQQLPDSLGQFALEEQVTSIFAFPVYRPDILYPTSSLT